MSSGQSTERCAELIPTDALLVSRLQEGLTVYYQGRFKSREQAERNAIDVSNYLVRVLKNSMGPTYCDCFRYHTEAGEIECWYLTHKAVATLVNLKSPTSLGGISNSDRAKLLNKKRLQAIQTVLRDMVSK